MDFKVSGQEYSRFICGGLGLQAGLSLLTSELTMVCHHVYKFEANLLVCQSFILEYFVLDL